MGACGHHAAHAVLNNWSNLISTKYIVYKLLIIILILECIN